MRASCIAKGVFGIEERRGRRASKKNEYIVVDLERRRPIQPEAATVLHISAGGHERIGEENDIVVIIYVSDLVRARVCG